MFDFDSWWDEVANNLDSQGFIGEEVDIVHQVALVAYEKGLEDGKDLCNDEK